MIELRADVELKDTTVVAMPKIMEEGYYTCTIRVEYEWKPPRCSYCKVFSHTQEECPKNIRLEHRLVPKKPTASSSSNKKKGVEPINRLVPKKPTASSNGNKKKGVEPINERDSYGNSDYDEDSYDDDIFEGQDLPQEIQALSDTWISEFKGN
uniref:Zinc knuckle CX2CX4HX4C n=1 Tax=Tanacetum cinerariifolium TaxID=118510 RepID=A0A6L2K780_TANCI|nr:hypothetical protein [Tanacetum cinerariifolium]